MSHQPGPSRYSGFEHPGRWVLAAAMAERAAATPDAEWIITTDGDTLTWGEAWDSARKVASFLSSLGVTRGEHVAVMLPNGVDFVRAWLGLSVLGAVGVFLNTELRGAFLKHQLKNAGVTLAITDATLAPATQAVQDGTLPLQRLLVVGAAAALPPFDVVPWANWRNATPSDGPLSAASDIACIMYTSGTSGPAKGVLMPHAHCRLYGIGAVEAVHLGGADRYYIVLPLFHVNRLFMQLAATILAGVPAIIRPRFSASAWLPDIRQHGATVTNLLGALAAFVIGQPGQRSGSRASPARRDEWP